MSLLTRNNVILITIASIPFLNYGIDIGFSLKPYMIFVVISMLIIPFSGSVNKISMEEFLYLFFLFYYLSTSLWSSYPEMSIKMVILMLINIVCFLWIRINLSFSLSKYGLKKCSEVFVKVNVCLYTISIVFYLYGLTFFMKGAAQEGAIIGTMLVDKSIPRFVGFSFDPNIATIFLSLPLFLSMYISKGKFSLQTLFFLVCILITWSRAAVITLIIIFVLRALHIILTTNRGRLKKIIGVLTTCIVLFFIFEFFSEHGLIGEMLDKRIDGIQRASGRFDAWENGVEVFMKQPVFGVGIYSFYLWNVNLFDDAHHLHNTYLDVLVEGGVVGISLFIIAVSLTFIRLIFSSNKILSLYFSYFWLFNLIMISSLTAISHEGFILNFVICALLLSRSKEFIK